ncbi:hypothetical protein V1511DRAFT_501064 [Dipodascopsis uninucleata]
MDYSTIDTEVVSEVVQNFEKIIDDIAERMNYLAQQTCNSANRHHMQCLNVAEEANFEIDRLRKIIERCDDIDLEFEKIKRIGEIVKEFKTRIAVLETQI